MATPTSYGDISQRTGVWAATEMLRHAQPILILQQFAQVKPLPANKADNIKFRRPVPFTAATVPLQEGVTPSSGKMTYEDVPVTIQQYGNLIEITDKVNDLAEDPVLKDIAMLLGEQAGLTMEAICWGVLRGGTNVFYTNGTQRTDVNTVINLNIQRRVIRLLKAQKALKFSAILDGSIKIGTRPIEAAYIAVCHTDVEADIRALNGFIPLAQYGSRQAINENELGSVEDVRYISSPELTPFPDAGGLDGDLVKSTTGTNADVYPVIYMGKESFGVVPLRGKGSVTPIIQSPDKIDKSDPLGQRGYAAWKAYFAAVRLNEAWMVRVECAVSDLIP